MSGSPQLPGGFRFRRQYLRTALRAIGDRKVGWVMRQGVKALTLPIADFAGRPFTGPILGNIVLTYRCNNACGTDELSTAEVEKVIDGFASLGTAGMSLTGGEPTLRPDCFHLLTYAKRTKMMVNLNTNAFTLNDRARVRALLDTGVDSLNISLDGARPETHDRLRGVPRGFDHVAQATQLIQEERAARGTRKPSLTYMFVLGPENHREALDFVDLARARGVEAASFMPLFGVYDDHKPATAKEVLAIEETVAALRRRKATGDGAFLDNSDDYLSLFGKSLRGEASPLKCYAGYHHVSVDAYGNIFPCALWFHQGRSVGNVRQTPLEEAWYGESYRTARRDMSVCHDCYWNCHTEINLLYQSAPA
jgi:MoaA/NifB/PqqE/SkfB family radical SAM enzyme